MITKEKRKEYEKRYREKHPEKCREQYHRWYYKKKADECKAKIKEQDAVIAELRKNLEKVEHDVKESYNSFREDIEWLLKASIRLEDEKATLTSSPLDRENHMYCKSVCQSLLDDFKKIERKHE